MVSSKCFQVESPSPFKFLAALMPPCAQTECERFTGTIENRSTLPPISAILITAESPARPPPTTIILGAAIYRTGLPSAFPEGTLRLDSTIVPFAPTSWRGRERKEYRLANPAPHSTRKNARQRRSSLFCALSPETIPHFAENSQMP